MTVSVRPSDDTAAFRLQLECDAIWNWMIAPGDRLPDIPLIEVDLGPIHLDRLRDTGPLALLFVRYAESPECGAALRNYQYTLAPALADLNVHVVAVSPQTPARLEAVKRRHDLRFLVASDPRHALIDALNIGYRRPGADLLLGTGRSVLPFAAVVLADRTGVVRYADVHADWSSLTAPRSIIRAARALRP